MHTPKKKTQRGTIELAVQNVCHFCALQRASSAKEEEEEEEEALEEEGGRSFREEEEEEEEEALEEALGCCKAIHKC